MTARRLAYVRVSREPIDSTRQVTPQVSVDLDKDGKFIGVEVLDIPRTPTIEIANATDIVASGGNLRGHPPAR